MKKFLTWFLCVALVLTTVLALAGCEKDSSDKDKDADKETVAPVDKTDAPAKETEAPQETLTDAEMILGTWNCEVDMKGIMDEIVGEDAFDGYFSFEGFTLTLQFTFEDDIMKLSLDEAAFEKSLEKIKDGLVEGMQKMLEDMAEEADVSLDELLEEIGSVEDLVDEAFAEVPEALKDEFEGGQYKYRVEDGKLYSSDDADSDINEDEYVVYEISRNELKFLDVVGENIDEDAIALLLPLVLKKVS